MADPSDYPPRSQALWTLAVLWLAGLVSYMHRLILSALVDPLAHDLHLSDARVSLLQGAAFAFVYVIAGLPLGRLADTRPRRLLLIAGAFVWCSGTIICGLATDFGTLFVGRIVVGIGEAALAPAAASLIADSFPPERRGTAIGIFLMGMAVGGPGAITVGGMLLDAAQMNAFASWPLISGLAPWRIVLVLIGGSGFVIPLAMLTVRDVPRRTVEAVMPITTVVRWARGALWLPLLLIAVALLSVGDYGVLSWAPATLSRGFGWTPGKVGVAFGVITTAAGISGPLLGGYLSDLVAVRRGEGARLTLAAAVTLIGVIGAALFAVRSPSFVLAGLGLWVFSSALASTTGIAALQTLVPATLRGTTMSLVAFCNTLLGLGLGPTAVALVTERGFGRPDAVGMSIAAVVVPAAILSIVFMIVARRMLRAGQATMTR